jgi:hypothetical protein
MYCCYSQCGERVKDGMVLVNAGKGQVSESQ